MKYLWLIFSGLRRNTIRVVLTVLSISVAFTLYGLLRPVGLVFDSGANLPGNNRLVVSPKHSLSDMLPVGHVSQIRQLEGVTSVTTQTWFAGTYKDPENTFAQYAVTPEEYLELYPELLLTEKEKKDFLNIRTAALVSRSIAEEFEFRVGDKIPLIPSIWMNRDFRHWEFDLVGIIETDDETIDAPRFLFRFDYFDEYRAFANGLVGNIILGVEEPEQSAALIRRVDALFANSPNETETSSERDYFLNFARQLGDIGLIVNSVLTAVFFTILLLTANTMSQAIRDRIPEMAILKTLGYRDWTILLLVFGESVTITVLGTVIGIVVAICLSIYISGLGANQFGPIRVTQDVVASAFMVAVLMGVIVGLQPALQAKRASIVDSLRRT
ncbi:MAG TPA: FtsX-like permease family protein [Pseudomonadales bacterium]|jgi:putative ABC transport system permease protein|nr:hypothetical protein [Gammaproteobacteria bacterium]MDP6026281.1 FtsX-like permease family protein [Pseudomonadales bacterium]MDP7314084.1 FtsX-like permease family protein [Pseudomonadales bacterium]MDP7451345.1 FtsX-like permease family protein [Arenicellales bacterium]HJP50169.1 FtsX-like permease family protein [Pseudomonadales bacterium]|tara:strand:+ start:2104 stop:3258 length:1155 start_codon:yes stop_codon:yes gene_type:complete